MGGARPPFAMGFCVPWRPKVLVLNDNTFISVTDTITNSITTINNTFTSVTGTHHQQYHSFTYSITSTIINSSNQGDEQPRSLYQSKSEKKILETSSLPEPLLFFTP